MKKSILVCALLLIAFGSFAQERNRGIGIRLGAPSGVTFKKFLPRNKAFELGVGVLANSWYDNYYKRSFRNFNRFDGYEYESHHLVNAVYFQGRYLFQNNIHIEGMMGKLDWYWGVGAVLKIGNVSYNYRDSMGNPRFDVVTDFDLGPEGILGMEYTFEDVPLTIFGEFSMTVEIIDHPGTVRGLSGIGVRYNF